MATAPVAIFFFNRPDLLAKSFASVRQARPNTLLLVCDGPRAERPSEKELVLACKRIVSKVDWKCRVFRNYSKENLGCRRRLASGITWVFSKVDRAIIVEDDCIPLNSFFVYATELLERYSQDRRVMSISGVNFEPQRATEYSYLFSRYVRVWGWASWRRAWAHYDESMSGWNALRNTREFRQFFTNPEVANFWCDRFDSVASKGFNTWDYQWVYAHLINNGLSIVPAENLVSNVGFRADATHTRRSSIFHSAQVAPLETMLRHPPFLARNERYDRRVEQREFGIYPVRRALNFLSALLKKE